MEMLLKKEVFPAKRKRNKKELYPMETIYGYRRGVASGKDMHYLTVRKKLEELLGKDRKKIKDILDERIREDLKAHSERLPDEEEWRAFLTQYRHPRWQSRVVFVMIAVNRSETAPLQDSSGRMAFGEYKDFGNLDAKGGQKGVTRKQFKHSKANRGQLIYHNGSAWKVQQVFVHESPQAVKKALKDAGHRLYLDGKALFYPSCQVFVPVEFKAGSQMLLAGRYTSRTIKSNGTVLLENANGEEYRTNIKYLVEANVELLR